MAVAIRSRVYLEVKMTLTANHEPEKADEC